MIRRAAVVLTLALLIAGSAGAAGFDFATLQIAPYEPPTVVPAFSLPDLQGRTVSLTDLKGKVVMLFFWAT